MIVFFLPDSKFTRTYWTIYEARQLF